MRKNYGLKIIGCIYLLLCLSVNIPAQNLLLSYEVSNWTSGIASSPMYSNHISGLTLSRHNIGISTTNACFGTTQWNGANTTLDTLSTKYVSFSIFAQTGYALNIDTFSFASYGSATAPKYGYWGYKIHNKSWIISPQFTFTTTATIYHWNNLDIVDADSVEFRFWALDAGGNAASIGGTSNIGSTGALRIPCNISGNDLWLSGSVAQLSCSNPTLLQNDTIMHNTAYLSWNGTEEPHSYLVSYRKVGENEWQSTTTNLSHILLSDLSSVSAYEWKVKNLCPDGESHWVIGKNFTTLEKPLMPIIQSSVSNISFGNIAANHTKTDTIFISGTNLNDSIHVHIVQDSLHYFFTETESIPHDANRFTIIIHYTPLSEGIHQAKLVLTSGTAESTINLTGTGMIPVVLLLKEYFEYLVGDTLCKTTSDTTADAVSGWRIHSQGAAPITVGNPLSFFRYDASLIGGSAVLDSNGQDIHKRFESQGTHEVIYIAFLLKAHSTPADYFMHLLKENSKTAYSSRIWLSSGASGIGISGPTAPTTYIPLAKDSTFLVVVKHQIHEVADSASTALYVFRTFPENEPVEPHQIYYGDGKAPINAIALRQYSAGQNIQVAGLRIAKTWEEVVKKSPCFPVSNIVATNITYKSAKLIWQSNAPLFKITYHIVDSAKSTTIFTSNKEFLLSNLQPNTSYECSIAVVCGVGDTSDAVNYNFTSLHQPQISIINPVSDEVFETSDIEVIYMTEFCNLETTERIKYILSPINIIGFSTSDTIKFTGLPEDNYTLDLLLTDNNHVVSDSTIKACTHFSIDLPCEAPTDLTVDSIYETKVHLTWQGMASSYRLTYNATQGNSVKSQIVRNNHIWLDSLQPKAEYSWNVAALCEQNAESENIYGDNFATASSAVVPINNSPNSIRLTPNPASDFINITITGMDENIEMRIVNSYGIIMYQENVKLQHTTRKKINIQNYPSGIYVIYCINDKVQYHSKFIIK